MGPVNVCLADRHGERMGPDFVARLLLFFACVGFFFFVCVCVCFCLFVGCLFVFRGGGGGGVHGFHVQH